ncbi:MAG TPA: hypothetical protein P5195_05535 [Anaerolineae bacterium]|nr:hypothetical protein [Anaerolineae bacterium]
MTERRPHWDEELIFAVMSAAGDGGHLFIDDIHAVIAAVEDWHEKFVMHGAFRVLAERAASAEADRDRLANQLLNEVPDSYIQMKARALTAEATIQRVRELHYNTATHHPSGCCSECGGTYPCPTVRALDGDGDA